jgi:hypothetical protein
MNKIIESQLKKVREADISHFDERTSSYFIPKKVDIKLEENNYYIIELNDILLKPNSSLNSLINNWNNGSIPKNKWYKIDVCQKLGDMVKINGAAFDYNTKIDLLDMWSGWLPIKEIKVLEKL